MKFFLRNHTRALKHLVEPGGHVGGAYRVCGKFAGAQPACKFDALNVREAIHFFENLSEA